MAHQGALHWGNWDLVGVGEGHGLTVGCNQDKLPNQAGVAKEGECEGYMKLPEF